MGYPMTWQRVIKRNHLEGGYENNDLTGRSMIAGDLLRLAEDSRDESHLATYSELSGATREQVKAIFAYFFDEDHR